MLKDKYEISIWRDVASTSRFIEEKIAVIGSDTLTSPYRAIEPELVENINGTNTLTFKMFYRCKDQSIGDLFYTNGNPTESILEAMDPALRPDRTFDEIPEEGYVNPFISFMTNERKVKLKWKDKWYDFVIKNCQEDSDKTTVTYTCTDAYINELAKNGYGLTFDNELMNNQGTAAELAARIVAGTDWKVIDEDGALLKVNPIIKDGNYTGFDEVVQDTNPDYDNWPVQSDDILQKNEEAVIPSSFLAAHTALLDGPDGGTINIPAHKQVLIFFPPLVDIKDGDVINLQFAYTPDPYIRDDESLLVTNAKSCTIENVTCARNNMTITFTSLNGEQVNLADVSSQYRATRIHNGKACIFDPITEKYCYIYKQGNTKYYYYRDVAPSDATAVANLLTNPSDFVDSSGWVIGQSSVQNPHPLWLALYPKGSYYENAHSYLRISNQAWYYNAGISGLNSFLPDGLQKGTDYVCFYQIYTDNGDSFTPTNTDADVNIKICHYSDTGGIYTPGTSVVQAYKSDTFSYDGQDWRYTVYHITESLSRVDLADTTKRVGFFIQSESEYAWIKNIQFCLYLPRPNLDPESNECPFIFPSDFSDYDLAKIRHNVYAPSANSSAKSIDDIVFVYQGTNKDNALSELTAEDVNYKKIRAITGKQSNRFNLLQTIAEQFNCWVCFYTGHEPNGNISYTNGQIDKYVYFKEEKGVQRDIGFVYGIDLQTIQRTIQSDNIVTRTIVNPNNNEFATYGSCNIVRADGNYSKSNSIFEFGYLTNSNLLDADALTSDLYSSSGYYTQLRYWYSIYDEKIERMSYLQLEKSKLEGYVELYDASAISAAQLKTTYITQIGLITGVNTSDINNAQVQAYIQHHDTTENIMELLLQWRTAEAQIHNYTMLRNNCQASLNSINAELATLTHDQNYALQKVREAEESFFKKYSQFIQEGSWQNDDYMDDNLYYLDALNVAYTSSRPQISYNVSVVRLSALEEYQNKVFHLGDITFIQDTEFFGTIDKNGIKTPYKEKIILTELRSYLDQPEKDNFIVQNYKSSFDDLFQRITASTQSLQYHEGEYARAANSFTATGAIKAKALQEAFDENKDLLMSSNNNRIIQDENGITLYSAEDPGQKVRINANGLFITSDNGIHWYNAIRSNGIATEALTAGSINAAEIAIVNGTQPALSMDSKGFTAYRIDDGVPYHNKFVRMDQFGLYGVDIGRIGEKTYQWYDDWTPSSTSEIYTYGRFGLLWDRFFLKGEKGNVTFLMDENGFKISRNSTDIFYVDSNGNLNFDGYIHSTYFTADSNGAAITNGASLSYMAVSGSGVEFRDNRGNVYLKVDNEGAHFTGDISAASGTFTGRIEATSGTIGQWTITSQGLYNEYTQAYIYPTQLTFGSYGTESYGINYQTNGSSSSYISTASLGDWTVEANSFTYSKYANHMAKLSTSELRLYDVRNTTRFKFLVNDEHFITILNGDYVVGLMGGSDANRGWGFGVGTASIYDASLATACFWGGIGAGGPSNTKFVSEALSITLGNGATVGKLYGEWDLNGNQIMVSGLTADINGSNISAATSLSCSGFFFAGQVGPSSYGGQLVGQWSLNGATIATTSDRSLKHSILSLPSQYSALFDQLNPVIFKYNENTSDRYHVGFIAQDVEQATLNAGLSTQDFAAYVKNEEGLCYLRYEEFIALNTWQIQKLKTRISELESRLAALESKI